MAKNKKVQLEELGDAICLILDEFEVELDEQLKKDIKGTAKVVYDELQDAHPAGAGRYHDWDEYNKGWKRQTTDKVGDYRITIYNAEKPGLTHLLEKQHVTSDGHSMSKAFPHIAPAAEKGAEELERRLKGGKK